MEHGLEKLDTDLESVSNLFLAVRGTWALVAEKQEHQARLTGIYHNAIVVLSLHFCIFVQNSVHEDYHTQTA